MCVEENVGCEEKVGKEVGVKCVEEVVGHEEEINEEEVEERCCCCFVTACLLSLKI
jgi:hypothetical protein